MCSNSQPPLITLTTDFGAGGHYVAQMKGAILRICRQAIIVDLNHEIPPQNVTQAAWELLQVVDAFPPNTCHVVVVDPGVGTARDVLLVRSAGQYYIAPDNGLLWPLCQNSSPTWIGRLCQPEYWARQVTNTFHGRDIMAPVAAHLGNGVRPSRLGEQISQIVRLPWTAATRTAQGIEGQIVHIDRFGNLLTNIGSDLLSQLSRPWVARLPIRGVVCHEWVTAYGERPPGTFVALVGSNGHLELAEVNGNAALRTGARVGDRVELGR